MTIEVQISRWHIALEVIVFLFLCLPAQGQQNSVCAVDENTVIVIVYA